MNRPAAPQAATALLERDAERERIDAALRRAKAGSGTLVLIEGSAGIGKTSLLRQALRRAEEAGLAAASARGSELEREFAFGVARQLLEPIVAGAGGHERRELMAGAAALAEPLFDLAALPGDGLPPADQSVSILHGLYWLCANAAQATPLLVAVDDAHWADAASLRFLAYLGQRLDGVSVVLLIATRPPETAATEDLLARLAGEQDAVTLTPAALSTKAVAALIAAAAGREPDPEFAQACRDATGGVPLLVRELIRALPERAIEPVAREASRVEAIGPRTIARYVVARVRRISPSAERLARAAAVLGTDAELPRVLRLADVGDDEALAALDALVLADVIASTRPLEFTHPVVRAAIYADLAPGERSGMHAGAATLLASERLDEERVATHLLATEPRGDERVVDVLVRTARAAVARGAPGSAAAYLERALAEPPEPDLRAVVLRELGLAEFHSGQLQRASDHLREGYRLTAPGRERAHIAQELAGCLRLEWRHQEASEVTAAALSDLAPDDDLALALRAELVLLEALEPTAYGTIERAARPPQRSSLGAAKYLGALMADVTVRMSATAEEARELAAESREAGIVDDLAHGGSLWTNVVAPLVIADGFALAEEMIAEAFDAARERESMLVMARAYVMRSMLRCRQGALAEAEADAQTALATAGDAPLYFSLLAVGMLAEALAERGAPDAAEAALRHAGAAEDIPDTFVHNWLLHSRGRLRLTQGRVDDAITDFTELGRRNERRGQPNPAVHPHRSGHALALLRQGAADRARALAQEETDLARKWGAPRALGMALRALGLCEGGEAGIEHLRESVDVLAGSGAELEHARSLVELGAAMRRARNRSEAQDPLRNGMELAHRCGAAPLVERAREELLATGARPRRIMRTDVDALTPSELRVARMAAQGLTNREIAQALFVTQRTVETHLTHVFQKLDIATRGEIAPRLTSSAD